MPDRGGQVVLDHMEIREILPHRYPMLLIDRVIELDPGKRAVAIKNVTANEPHFMGHYPEYPIMPGVLILESMAQVAGIAVLTVVNNEGKTPMFAGVDKARFRRPVTPGDQLRVEVIVEKVRGSIGRMRGKATVDGEPVAEAELLFALTDGAGTGRKAGQVG